VRRRSTPMASASMTRPYFLVLALAPADSVFSPDDDDGVAAVEGFGGVFAEFEFGFDEVTGGVLVLGPGPGPVFAGVLEDPAFGDCCGAGLDDGGFRGEVADDIQPHQTLLAAPLAHVLILHPRTAR